MILQKKTKKLVKQIKFFFFIEEKAETEPQSNIEGKKIDEISTPIPQNQNNAVKKLVFNNQPSI
jgi:hypothetical protein